ncbi:MAG: hypothetical protein A2534_03275 [Candidatus Magasanikbacteria bacterium RIFOXYD2_FULL_39_9]|uniref:Uncharacterized protein n=1 Tax=Candidatus Magasanikbacteria bacterium RIFOXYD1_FULL_40_23 TaxID=1798705 RepID=A0A1F6PAA8_9BACT|nr:MAG: hypothetical protein A2534_03275 [Candidatus Magasanikbacteria bacterium RIFOXYD2_FULL_39_9]OGH93111.1 MAG: hypothetical protein A2563_00280 [Candidatus Magasanikbacteria bacterium RIFOXYD1_FULL_40_23]
MRRGTSETGQQNNGYEAVDLSPLEKAGLEPGDVVRLKAKTKDVVPPTEIKAEKAVLPEDDFSDEPTKVFKRKPKAKLLTPEDHKENSRKRVENSRKAVEPSQDTKDALQMVRDISTPTGEALAEVRALSESHNDPEVVAEREKSKKNAKSELEQAREDLNNARQNFIDEAEEVNDLDRIRDSIANSAKQAEVKKLDEEIKAGFKSANEDSVSRSRVKKSVSAKETSVQKREAPAETDKVKNAKIFAENAILAYSKLYIEYDPKAISKLHKGAEDAVAALDLTTVTPPPLRAIFSSKGRQLRDVYGKVQEAIKKYNDEVEAS